MDYSNLIADKQYIINRSHASGREGHDIEFIVLHHNAGVRQSTETVGNFWEGSGTSAHYQVEADGTIGQLVHDYDTAYHAGIWEANTKSIGIEHANITGPNDATPWDISDATLKYGGYLTGALCYGYGLGAPTWGWNVFPHSDFSSTACPFQLRDKYRDDYMGYAVEMYNRLSGGEVAPAYAPPAPTTVDRREQLAKVLHCSADASDLNLRALVLVSASDWGGNNFPCGIEFAQDVVGTEVDGIWGENSEEAHDETVAEVQRILGVTVDGVVGPITATELTRVINN
jgi:hypothetical protein